MKMLEVLDYKLRRMITNLVFLLCFSLNSSNIIAQDKKTDCNHIVDYGFIGSVDIPFDLPYTHNTFFRDMKIKLFIISCEGDANVIFYDKNDNILFSGSFIKGEKLYSDDITKMDIASNDVFYESITSYKPIMAGIWKSNKFTNQHIESPVSVGGLHLINFPFIGKVVPNNVPDTIQVSYNDYYGELLLFSYGGNAELTLYNVGGEIVMKGEYIEGEGLGERKTTGLDEYGNYREKVEYIYNPLMHGDWFFHGFHLQRVGTGSN